ncbi:Ldh family oxidoreductase [Paraburkholderia fynbosensis]|uniref:Putative oxidoreductase YjmC n=1 Tax=Paraburkholderia fynbosensis TaxID=1200993 RepID=A0A6J5H3I3_9BURK|nr:Ldh family oxidoreductase [Paraburkholderia fynbosensis]CAB3810438.1 putative oxidoreductase YjmC [Paraburkholderia fynbosensis]
MRVSIEAGRELVRQCFTAQGYSEADASVIADQIIDIELRGAHFGGFSRALSLCEMAAERGLTREAPAIVRETDALIHLDGGGNIGYTVARKVTLAAIQKAKAIGVGIGAAYNTFFTGQYAHYVEMATKENLVAIAFGSSGAWVAPHGTTEAKMGANPFAIGIPTLGDPVIVDIGTSAAMVGDLRLAARTGKPLPPGVAFDKCGLSTTDALEALEGGAIASWGGHKGSGIAITLQMLGLMIGASGLPRNDRNCGYLVILLDPERFGDCDSFLKAVEEYGAAVTASVAGSSGNVRLPFSRSARERRERERLGYFDVPDGIYEQMTAIAAAVPKKL